HLPGGVPNGVEVAGQGGLPESRQVGRAAQHLVDDVGYGLGGELQRTDDQAVDVPPDGVVVEPRLLDGELHQPGEDVVGYGLGGVDGAATVGDEALHVGALLRRGHLGGPPGPVAFV